MTEREISEILSKITKILDVAALKLYTLSLDLKEKYKLKTEDRDDAN